MSWVTLETEVGGQIHINLNRVQLWRDGGVGADGRRIIHLVYDGEEYTSTYFARDHQRGLLFAVTAGGEE